MVDGLVGLFQDGPERFDSVRMAVAIDVLTHAMVHRLVGEGQAAVGARLVGVHGGPGGCRG